MRLAAALRPDPLGELERSPRCPNRNWGCLLLKGMGKGKEKDKKGEGRKGKDDLHPTFLRPWPNLSITQLHLATAASSSIVDNLTFSIPYSVLVFLNRIEDHRILRSGSALTCRHRAIAILWCTHFHFLLHYVITIHNHNRRTDGQAMYVMHVA